MALTGKSIAGTLSTATTVLIITLATGFAFFIRIFRQCNSTADATGEPLILVRMKTAQTLVLLLVSSCSLWCGAYVYALAPGRASFGAIFLYEAARKPVRR